MLESNQNRRSQSSGIQGKCNMVSIIFTNLFKKQYGNYTHHNKIYFYILYFWLMKTFCPLLKNNQIKWAFLLFVLFGALSYLYTRKKENRRL